jgi:hypothetical protein
MRVVLPVGTLIWVPDARFPPFESPVTVWNNGT